MWIKGNGDGGPRGWAGVWACGRVGTVAGAGGRRGQCDGVTTTSDLKGAGGGLLLRDLTELKGYLLESGASQNQRKQFATTVNTKSAQPIR